MFSFFPGSQVFPLPFCKHRWIENVRVAQRAILIWPQVQQYIKHVREDKSKMPKNKSFKILEECFKDALLLPKLHSYVSLAELVIPFLTKYQTDVPMLPFLAEDLSSVIKDLLQRVVKPSAMESLVSPVKVANFNFEDNALFKHVLKIDTGFLAERALKEGNIGELSVRQFKTQFKAFVTAAVKKILQKSPVTYSLCRALSCLDPSKLHSDRAISHFSTVIQKLEEAGHIDARRCDIVKGQFQKVRESLKIKQVPFSRTTDRLDAFWHSELANEPDCADLWGVVKLLLTMSHGQAAVERGFSVNKEVMTENKSKETLIAQRLVCSHILKVGGVKNIKLTPSMISAASAARSKYNLYLEKEKKRKEGEQTNRKRKEREEELTTMRENIKRIKTAHVTLVADADDFALKAEAKSDFTLLAKSNAFRSAAAAKKEELAQLEKKLKDRELEFTSNP